MPVHPDPTPEPQGPLLPVEWVDFVDKDSERATALGAAIELLSDDELALRLRALDEGSDLESLIHSGGRTQHFAALRRAVAQARALTWMPPKVAPGELEGLVVASLYPGARQGRVVSQVQSLAPRPAPRNLDEAVARMVLRGAAGADQARGAFRAPGVLDRLVEEALADPAKAAARSMASRLSRPRAPDELAERVESNLRRGDGSRVLGPGLSKDESAEQLEPIGARSVAAALVSMGLAVALVAAIGLRGQPSSIPTTEPGGDATAVGLASNDAGLGDGSERVVEVRLEVVMLDEDGLSDADRNMLRLLGGAL